MIRIVALNQEPLSEPEEDLPVTKEAQGAIAETEYVRAIKLKSQGKPELALSLFSELLETEVLNEIGADKEHEKLWAIRYNCFKNSAIIYEERADNELALQNYMHAMHIDDSDVYSMHRFGQLALRLNALDAAEYAFDKCLQRNPMHWNAADGILQILCRQHNILGACGWALAMYRRNPRYERAIRTLQAIASNFSHSIPFYEQFWGTFPLVELKASLQLPASEMASVFPPPPSCDAQLEAAETQEKTQKLLASLKPYQIKSSNWLTLAQYILDVYQHLEQTEQCFFFLLSYDDLILSAEATLLSDTKLASIIVKSQSPLPAGDENSSTSGTTESEQTTTKELKDGIKVEGETNSQGSTDRSATPFAPPTVAEPVPMDPELNNEENSADSGTKTEQQPDAVAAKPKPRRRCSDLHFLEQWGWHKNRRYASRKKPQPERPETDSSLNGFLRKVFAKFTETTFSAAWPFNEAASQANDTATTMPATESVTNMRCMQCDSATATATLDEFQGQTQAEFGQLLAKLKAKRFDLMVLIYKWLKYVSLCWHQQLPPEVQSVYLQLFNCYLKHFDFSTWNQLTNNNYEASFRICLLYLELDYARTLQQNTDLNEQWQSTFRHLQFNAGCAYVACYKRYSEIYKLRLINLEYLWCTQRAELELCVTCLKHIGDMMSTTTLTATTRAGICKMEADEEEVTRTLELHLPNLPTFCLTKANVCARRSELQRQIALNRVPQLYDANRWQELATIIIDNIAHSRDQHELDAWMQDFRTQIELLLQSLWELSRYEDCLLWAERFLHYTAGRYLAPAQSTQRQRHWAESINYIYSYLEALLLNEGADLVVHLGDKLSRLVQNVMRLLTHQLDAPLERSGNAAPPELETKRPWVVLHQLLLREEQLSPVLLKHKTPTGDAEDDDELIPPAFLLLFIAHEQLGRRLWCTRDQGALLQYVLSAVTPNLRAPLYDDCRDAVHAYIEQVTYCLYGYPPKKYRSRHLEDHEATQIELTWPRAIHLYDLYRPESLPEFNSYKLESITADMEQLLLKIVGLMPRELDASAASGRISDYISGAATELLSDTSRASTPQPQRLPYKISSLYYLLADYYFKNRDFSKTIRYYTLDLVNNATRFDSWAGMALSKASRIETQLNGLTPFGLVAFLAECEHTLRCFEQCIQLNRNQTLLWIEYGSFAYTIHAYCSRFLKQHPGATTAEDKILAAESKHRMLNIAYNCFSLAAQLQSVLAADGGATADDSSSEIHDEKWLCHFMLGKIAEKRREEPKVYLQYYLAAASHLYENNATYPIKINHSNPTTLAVEALEVFYRTNSAIIKYLERHEVIARPVGDLFGDVLSNLASSSFAYNKAKVDGSSFQMLKRKNGIEKTEATAPSKMLKENSGAAAAVPPSAIIQLDSDGSADKLFEPEVVMTVSEAPQVAVEPLPTSAPAGDDNKEAQEKPMEAAGVKEVKSSNSPTRRESQESAATATTTTLTTSSTTTSTSSSTDSSTTDSDSDTDGSSADDTNAAKKKADNNTPYSADELEEMYKVAVRNLEECVTRFPEHYKSIYRLVRHYMLTPSKLDGLARCEQLLIGQYRTGLGNQVNGLFYDRKTNNLFNGIWRIPSSEIDRPGSFSAHLVKCVAILIEMLSRQQNHRMLIDIGLQLYKTPDNDKRYIKDNERMELYQLSMNYTAQILRNMLQGFKQQRNDPAIIELLIDIYKIHKKCVKYMNQKEPLFTQLMIDVYRWYIQDKVECVPEHLNFLDLAIKLCLQELLVRKNMEKAATSGYSATNYAPVAGTTVGAFGAHNNTNLGDAILGFNAGASSSAAMQTAPRPIQIPGLAQRGVRSRSQNSNTNRPVNINEPVGMLPTTTTVAMPTTMAPMPLTTTNSYINDVLQSPNFMSMITSLNASAIVQQDTVGFQKLVAEYYKQIMEANRIAALNAAPGNAMPIVATNPSVTLSKASYPTSLTAALPSETTITPATTKPLPQPIPNVRLPTFDLTITPTLDKPHSVPVSSTPTALPATPPGAIFVKPLVNMQEQPPMSLPDLPDSLTITTLTKAQVSSMAVQQQPALTVTSTISSAAEASSRPAASAKGRSGTAYKGKQAAAKPYSRVDTAPSLTSPMLTGNMSAQQQMQLMATYADLLKHSSLLRPGNLSASQRGKAPAVLELPSGSGKPNPFTLPPGFDASSITMTALPTLPPTKRSSPNLFGKAGSSSTPSPPVFTPPPQAGTPPANAPPPNFPLSVSVSPTKTLQQKLAERQKANLMQEAKQPGKQPERKPSIDVIILD